MHEVEATVEPWEARDLQLVAEENEKFALELERRAEARESALVKLAKLGLSADEVAAITGG